MDSAEIVDFIHYRTREADDRQARLDLFRQAQKQETVRRTQLEWVLADLLADIQTA